MHRMNSFEMQEKIEEQKQIQNEDLETFRIFESDILDKSETDKIFERFKNGVKMMSVNKKIREMEHNINVKNILDDLELYGELL